MRMGHYNGMEVIHSFHISPFFNRDFGNNLLDCSYCDLESLKLFLKTQTHLGKASAKCDGTNTYVVDHDFQNCIGKYY